MISLSTLFTNYTAQIVGATIIVVGCLAQRSHAFKIESTIVTRSRQAWRAFGLFTSSASVVDDEQDLPSAKSSGTIVARIFPREYIDYERLKPANRRSEDVASWRERVRPNANKSSTDIERKIGDDSKPEDIVVVLDIDLKTTIYNDKMKQLQPIHTELHLHRRADETAQRTLRRIEISTRRKIDSFRTDKKHKSSLQSRASSCASATTDDGTSATCLMVWGPSSSEGSSISEDEDLASSDGYRRFQIEKEMNSDELWQQLRQYPKSNLWLDVLKEESSGIKLGLELCPPTILSVQTFENFRADIFVGSPLVIKTKVVHAERALIVWFVGSSQVCYDSHFYTPREVDVGKEVTVLISPFCAGVVNSDDEVYQFEKVVQKRPFLPVIELRTSWLPRSPNDDSTLRVMSYNLLADLYASREFDQTAMYNHCAPEFIARTRRMPLLVYEILAHQPDIVCLQEVDANIHEQLLLPVLKANGYNGYYSNKASAQLEGCSLFWSLRSFEQDADQEEFALRELFETTSLGTEQRWKSLKDIQSLLDRKPELSLVIQEKVGQVLQVASLRLKNPIGKAKRLVVGNTHLFYHPMADHIRCMQAYMVVKQIDNIRRRVSPDSQPSPLILCGDLNSGPLSGAVTLLLNRQLEPDHFETWKNMDAYSWDKGENSFLMEHGFIGNDVGEVPVYIDEAFCDAQEAIGTKPHPLGLSTVPPRICLPSCFPELASGYKELPEFTNYAIDFSETLDYVFASKPSPQEVVGFEVASSAPVPTKMEMEYYVAMPNENMPSDHISIACDLKWKHYGT